MPNMSYCRFSNTYSDLHDCAMHLLDDLGQGGMSGEEASARRKLLLLCQAVVERAEEESLLGDDEWEQGKACERWRKAQRKWRAVLTDPDGGHREWGVDADTEEEARKLCLMVAGDHGWTLKHVEHIAHQDLDYEKDDLEDAFDVCR